MLTWPRRQQRYTFLHITQTYQIQKTQLSKQKDEKQSLHCAHLGQKGTLLITARAAGGKDLRQLQFKTGYRDKCHQFEA